MTNQKQQTPFYVKNRISTLNKDFVHGAIELLDMKDLPWWLEENTIIEQMAKNGFDGNTYNVRDIARSILQLQMKYLNKK